MRALFIFSVCALLMAGCNCNKPEDKSGSSGTAGMEKKVPEAESTGPAGSDPQKSEPAASEATGAPEAEAAQAGASPRDPRAVAVVERAFAAYGGAELLKANLQEFSVLSEGTYAGTPYRMTTSWIAPDKLVMDVDDGSMVMAYLEDSCFLTYHGVVVDCPMMMKPMASTAQWVAHTMNLYPLGEPGVALTYVGETAIRGIPCEEIEVQGASSLPKITFAFEKANGRLLQSRYSHGFGPMAGSNTMDVLEHRDFQGVAVPWVTSSSMGNFLVMKDTAVEFKPGKVEASAMQRPTQIALGQNSLRVEPEHTAAVITHKGPYEQSGASIGRLYQWIGANNLIPMGPTELVFLKGPMDVESPAQMVTEIRIPVGIPEGVKPTMTEEIMVRTVPETRLAWRVEQGNYPEVSARYGDLAAWVQSQGLTPTGAAGMITFNSPMDTPPDKLISELYFPVETRAPAAAEEVPAGE